MSEIIRCSTCKYYEYKLMQEARCTHVTADKLSLYRYSYKCLSNIPVELREITKHEYYPHLSKFYNIHKYTYWKPKAVLKENTIYNFLEKKDFEI